MAKALEDKLNDCVVIGGGPAGLTAAIYLARYHLSVTVFHDESSRASIIPVSHNHAGFPGGISGTELLARMTAQAQLYGAAIRRRKITTLRKADNRFVAEFENGSIRSRAVLLATGVVNRRPAMPQATHDEAVARGLLRYCPVCDGFEVTDKPVGIIGTGTKGFKEAVFLRSYTKDLTLISPEDVHDLSELEMSSLAHLGIRVEVGPIASTNLDNDMIRVITPTETYAFASIYPALGSDICSHLALQIGARVSDEGCITVDGHQRTTVPGFYAAGDVVAGLDQISHAMGQAGVAATTIRNDLGDQAPLVRF
ncbi:thioredoxin reductase [Rhizobium leguminosarum bv. trifolii WSM597]|uniref:Thioredoxin reductase n=1 Tax=Rhizobium leguminosarum bv. trifolii WSM597 TaxID=754764 RepID=J0GVV1_RHILT|nr:NAD(P)/FAD-dependent oxidoreductase [Rhizobium leguminosarum]EJB01730.1 thioredoxin reductase [Rhizobium leguminosarum bv. trifolii WSM597]